MQNRWKMRVMGSARGLGGIDSWRGEEKVNYEVKMKRKRKVRCRATTSCKGEGEGWEGDDFYVEGFYF